MIRVTLQFSPVVNKQQKKNTEEQRNQPVTKNSSILFLLE